MDNNGRSALTSFDGQVEYERVVGSLGSEGRELPSNVGASRIRSNTQSQRVHVNPIVFRHIGGLGCCVKVCTVTQDFIFVKRSRRPDEMREYSALSVQLFPKNDVTGTAKGNAIWSTPVRGN